MSKSDLVQAMKNKKGEFVGFIRGVFKKDIRKKAKLINVKPIGVPFYSNQPTRKRK